MTVLSATSIAAAPVERPRPASQPPTPLVATGELPRHIGIIMDGNGRWASERGLPRCDGHREGSKAVRRVVRAARRLGVRALTLYAFSHQNWQRPDDEVAALMGLLHEYLVSERDEILDNDIRLRAVGEVSALPAVVREVLDRLRADSADNTHMVLTLALSYGGQEEIARVARALAQEAVAGQLDPAAIDVDVLRRRLPSLDVGEPDLIIRTGGEQRLSNFLLFGSAYSELYFTGLLWPEFETADLYAAIASYQGRERRFGLVLDSPGARVASEPPGR